MPPEAEAMGPTGAGKRAVCLTLENSTGVSFPTGLPGTAEVQSAFDSSLLLVKLLKWPVKLRHEFSVQPRQHAAVSLPCH